MTADVVFRGGRVWTGAAVTDALVVADGRVVAHGARDLDGLVGPATREVDLAGATVLPAFRDGHVHVLEGGTESLACDLTDAADVTEVLERVRRYAEATDDAAWLLGYSYPPEVLPGGVGRAVDLDRVVDHRPVALWSGDHHMAWCNTRALQAAGIGAATPDPPRGTIVRDADGAPTGLLLEAAMDLLAPHLPAWTADHMQRGLRLGLQRLAAAGITFAQEAAATPDRVAVYGAVADAGDLTADLDLALRVDPARWRDQVDEFGSIRADVAGAAAGHAARDPDGGRLTAGTVKLFLDGVIEGGTGSLLEPYADAPDSHGIANWELRELVAAAIALDAAGFELHMHAIGDAAVRMALDTVAAVRRANGPRERRAVVAHTHLVHPTDLPRFRQLGVVANLEPLWAQRNGVMTELTEPRLGPERSTWQYPIGSLVRDGAHVSFGSDWPVSSVVPLEGIAVATTRQTAAGDPPAGWLPGERVDLVTALRAYTVGTAHQAGAPAGVGTLAVGAPADLLVVDGDPFRTELAALGALRVLATWRRGRPVHGPAAASPAHARL